MRRFNLVCQATIHLMDDAGNDLMTLTGKIEPAKPVVTEEQNCIAMIHALHLEIALNARGTLSNRDILLTTKAFEGKKEVCCITDWVSEILKTRGVKYASKNKGRAQ